LDKLHSSSQTISDEYREQQSELHERTSETGVIYGGAAKIYAPLVAQVIEKIEAQHVLDYGCGSTLQLPNALKGLIKHRFTYQAYDPAVPKYASPPVPAELVVCIDVLEHIEEDRIDAVLDHLEELTEAVGVFTVATGPAHKVLADGRNAHILQRPPEWWLPRLMCRFDLQTFQAMGPSAFYVIVYARSRVIESPDGTKLS
jgi:hypothetical protein